MPWSQSILKLKKESTWRSQAPPVAANRHCSPFLDSSIHRRKETTISTDSRSRVWGLAIDLAYAIGRRGFIFQAFNLIGDLTVYENVELPLTYRETGSGGRKKKVQNALERVEMAHRAKHYPAQLSGGQQQRVAVARALVGDPLILLADEPTGNLDSKNGDSVMELLRDIHRNGATICMVTHDPRYAHHAERTVHLFDGKISEEVSALHQ